MREVVCIPWRGSEQPRVDAFTRTWNGIWRPLGLPVYTGDSGAAKFNRGASRNAAARAAGDWEVALFVDADVQVDPGNIRRALVTAYTEDVVVFPHDRYHALSASGRAERMTTAPTNGGALAISREAWEYVRGYDARFTGWGYEDAAFYLATTTILGPPIRVPGVMAELHHPKTGRGRPPEDAALYQRYRHARGNREAMLAVVTEDPLE